MPHLDTEFEQRRRINQAARSPEAAVAAAAEAGGVTQGWGGSRGTAIRSGEPRCRLISHSYVSRAFNYCHFFCSFVFPLFYDTLRGAGSAGGMRRGKGSGVSCSLVAYYHHSSPWSTSFDTSMTFLSFKSHSLFVYAARSETNKTKLTPPSPQGGVIPPETIKIFYCCPIQSVSVQPNGSAEFSSRFQLKFSLRFSLFNCLFTVHAFS